MGLWTRDGARWQQEMEAESHGSREPGKAGSTGGTLTYMDLVSHPLSCSTVTGGLTMIEHCLQKLNRHNHCPHRSYLYSSWGDRQYTGK